MVVITKEELEEFENCLSDVSDIINGDDGTDGLNLYYEYCNYQHKRLRKLLDNLEIKYNRVYDLFEIWYERQSQLEQQVNESK